MTAPIAKTCGVCFCEVEESETFVCCDGDGATCLTEPSTETAMSTPCLHYFHAEGCITEYFTSASQDRAAYEHFQKHRALRCPSSYEGCRAHITLSSVATGGAATLAAFVACTQEIACTVERRATEARVEREAMKASAEAKSGIVQRLVSDVRDVLTSALSCPHCQTPFIDFSGCLALTCAACSKEFCGVCCRKHKDTADGHKAVVACLARLSPADQKRYDFHSTYFISQKGWTQWSDKLKVQAILEFLKTLRRELVWDSFSEIDAALSKENLLSQESREDLVRKVYSHDVDAVHLVRIPNTFWLLYSTKKQEKFEDVVRTVALSQQERVDVGKRIVDRVRKQYPSWVAIKNTVPGEQFEAINYPPEFLPLITKVMDEWGRGRYW